MAATWASHRTESSWAFFRRPFLRLENVTCLLVGLSILLISIFPFTIFLPWLVGESIWNTKSEPFYRKKKISFFFLETNSLGSKSKPRICFLITRGRFKDKISCPHKSQVITSLGKWWKIWGRRKKPNKTPFLNLSRFGSKASRIRKRPRKTVI